MGGTTIGLEDGITLYFLIARQTINRCNGVFGFVKRELKIRDVVTPQEMVRVVSESSGTNNAVLPIEVRWTSWKTFLGNFHTIPSIFKITRYHDF